MKYQNKRNGKIATLVEQNEKYKTVILEFEDGTSQSMTMPTFKRWWKAIDEEDISSDGTAYSQIMKEIIQDEKAEVEAIMNAKKEAGVEIMDLDPSQVEIVSEPTQKAYLIPRRESVTRTVQCVEKSQFGTKYSMNKRGLLVKGLYIVFRKYGIRVYMKPETYVKLTFCTTIKYKATDTNNKLLPKSIAVPNENIEETLGIIFNNMNE